MTDHNTLADRTEQDRPVGWINVRYTCVECDDEHHPDEREDHEFRLGVSCCPECGAIRARVTHDLTGPIEYDDKPVSVA